MNTYNLLDRHTYQDFILPYPSDIRMYPRKLSQQMSSELQTILYYQPAGKEANLDDLRNIKLEVEKLGSQQ